MIWLTTIMPERKGQKGNNFPLEACLCLMLGDCLLSPKYLLYMCTNIYLWAWPCIRRDNSCTSGTITGAGSLFTVLCISFSSRLCNTLWKVNMNNIIGNMGRHAIIRTLISAISFTETLWSSQYGFTSLAHQVLKLISGWNMNFIFSPWHFNAMSPYNDLAL